MTTYMRQPRQTSDVLVLGRWGVYRRHTHSFVVLVQARELLLHHVIYRASRPASLYLAESP